MAFAMVVLLSGIVAACVVSASAEESARDGVFVHISHGKDDSHRFLMALNMANIMADGIRIADKKAFFSFTKGRILTLDY